MAELSAEQFNSLVGGGDCPLHSHSFDRAMSHEQVLAYQGSEAARVVGADFAVTYSEDYIFVDATTPVTLQLPTARGGKSYTVVKIAGGSIVTVLPGAADTINGVASQVITDSYKPLRIKAVRSHGWIEV